MFSEETCPAGFNKLTWKTRYSAWCSNQGYNHRGQRFRSRYRYCLGQDCLGSLRADHKQPGERRVFERCAPGLSSASVLLLSLSGMGGKSGDSLHGKRRLVLEMADLIQYKVRFCRGNVFAFLTYAILHWAIRVAPLLAYRPTGLPDRWKRHSIQEEPFRDTVIVLTSISSTRKGGGLCPQRVALIPVPKRCSRYAHGRPALSNPTSDAPTTNSKTEVYIPKP
ncbi:hypothetical protein VTK26DRAFT_7028 [Humicola hyalothermophila]